MLTHRRHGGALVRAAMALVVTVLSIGAPLRASAAETGAARWSTDNVHQAWAPGSVHQAASRTLFFPETGYAIDEPRFAEYFQQRGQIPTFGFPISRTFQFLGQPTQFFQRIVIQRASDGAVRPLNLLDPGMLAYTHMNGSTFPAPDEGLAASAPSPRQPDYATAVVDFVRHVAPESHNGQPVRFFTTFMGTVSPSNAFPNGGDVALLPLVNLEIWGVPTSAPASDPRNGGFIYQRFQRGIMHYDAACRCTQGLLLADYLKALLTGENLPGDLEQQARGSVFLRQYSTEAASGPRRPGLLPATDLTNAFSQQAAQYGRGGTMTASAIASREADSALPLRARVRADPELAAVLDAVEASGSVSVADALVKADADISFGALPPLEYARYSARGSIEPLRRSIVLSTAIRRSDPRALATLIVHEGTHMRDDLAGAEKRTIEACFQFEIRAFAQQALAWQAMYGPAGKPQPADELDVWLNSWLASYREGPDALDRRVREFYRQPRPTGCLP